MLPIIYAAALCIFLLVVLILFVSFNVIIDIRKKKDLIDKRVTIKWMGLSYTIKKKEKKGKIKKSKKETKPEKKKPKETKTKEEKPKKSRIWNISEIPGIISKLKKPILRLVDDLLHVVKIQKLSTDITFGFPDPSDTGIVCGYLYAANALLHQKFKVYSYSIKPQFTDTVFDFYFVAEGHLRICSIFLPFLSFVSNRKVLSVAWTIIRRQYIPKPSINI